MIGLPLCNLSAQNTYVADTLQADGYLRIVAPTLNNLFALVQMEQGQFEELLQSHGYSPNTREAKGTYKKESFQATYNIHKNKYLVEFYFSTMVGSLVSLKAEIKKRFPAAKLSGGGTDIENYDFEEQSASGKHIYICLT